MAALNLNQIALDALVKVFNITGQYQSSFTLNLREAKAGNYEFDPTTGTTSATVTPKDPIVIADTRILLYTPKEIKDSNGTITTNSRKVIFRYSDLSGEDLSNVDYGTLPTGKQVEISEVKLLPNEFDPVFVMLRIDGVN